jgi:hypothetical protein
MPWDRAAAASVGPDRTVRKTEQGNQVSRRRLTCSNYPAKKGPRFVKDRRATRGPARLRRP